MLQKQSLASTREELELINYVKRIYFSSISRSGSHRMPIGKTHMRASNIKLPHCVIVKSTGLLPMHYTIRELADALGAVERTLRDWIANGAPHLRDTKGHIWINGKEFAGWVTRIRKPDQKRKKLKDHEGYCMHCRQAVEMLQPKTRHVRGKLTTTRGICSCCGGTIHRGGRIPTNPAPIFPGGPEGNNG